MSLPNLQLSPCVAPAPASPHALAVGSLFREHRALVARALRRFGVAERELADATQEVFMVVHRRLPEFEGRAQVTTWLYRIAFNVASAHRRKAVHRHERLMDCATPEVADHAADERHEQREVVGRVFAALERVHPHKAEAFLLHEVEERPMAEVAERLQIPLKTAFSRYYAARRQVLQQLRKEGVAFSLWSALLPGRILERPGRSAIRAFLRQLASASPLARLALALVVCALPAAPHPAPAGEERASALPAIALATDQALHPEPRAHSFVARPERAPSLPTPPPPLAPARKPPPRPATARVAARARVSASRATVTPVTPVTPVIRDEFQVIHASAADLTPIMSHPLARAHAVSPGAALRIVTVNEQHSTDAALDRATF